MTRAEALACMRRALREFVVDERFTDDAFLADLFERGGAYGMARAARPRRPSGDQIKSDEQPGEQRRASLARPGGHGREIFQALHIDISH